MTLLSVWDVDVQNFAFIKNGTANACISPTPILQQYNNQRYINDGDDDDDDDNDKENVI